MFKKVTKIALAGVIGVGTLVGAGSLASAENTTATYDSKAKVMFEANTDITEPVDPENPDPTEPVDPTDPVEPGTEGPLSIDYVSNFDFGTQKTSGNAETYTAKPVEITLYDEENEGEKVMRAPYAQVTDNRGTHAGWTLTVKQPEQLNNGTADLEGAQITIGEGTVTGTPTDKAGVVGKEVILSENAQPVFTAANEAKGGTWVNSFGTADEVNVKLSIPAGTKIDQDTEYTTDLNWELTDAPGN